MPRRSFLRVLLGPLGALVVAAAGAVTLGVGILTTSSPSGANTPVVTTPGGAHRGFYLVIGASASLGVQPTGNPAHNGHFTNVGYGDDLVRLEAARGVTLDMTKVGCMGETAESMLSGDHCYHPPQTQLSAALAFLSTHRDEPGVVSVDLGFNDVRPCLWVVPLATACANQGIAHVRAALPKVLAQLKAAAGPHVHFVGLTYADPFVYRYTKGGDGPARAAQSRQLMGELNAALASAYQGAGVAVADVPSAFDAGQTSLVASTPWGTVPADVAKVCHWTWMCAPHPWGPDDHPNRAGFVVIAQQILAALPSTL